MKKWPVIVLLAMICFGCKKRIVPKPGTSTTMVTVDTPTIPKGLTMLIDGKKWAATSTKAEIGTALYIEGVNSTHRIRMNSSRFAGAGSYIIPDSPGKWIYIELTDLRTDSAVLSVRSNVAITKVSDTDIQGAFQGSLHDGWHRSAKVTEGRFNISLR